MKKFLLLSGFIFSGYILLSQNIFPTTGSVGIGTTSPSTLFEIKKGIDMSVNGTQYVAPYDLGMCNDFAAGATEQYLLLTPYISMASGSPSAGLNGKLTFYRGHTAAYNLTFEYEVNIQTAYNSTYADVKPFTSTSQLVNIYKIDYGGVPYVALKVKEVSGTSVVINFQGYYWNNINSQKPQLILASDASNISIFKAYEPILGGIICGNTNGNILIGKISQTNAGYKLDIAGNVRADKLVVNTTGADYVFDSSYKLFSLQEVETYIQEHHHLPQIASADDMQSNGIDVGANQTKLLEKTEELTLYLIEQNKNLKAQSDITTAQSKQLIEQSNQIADLKLIVERQQKAIEQLLGKVKGSQQK